MGLQVLQDRSCRECSRVIGGTRRQQTDRGTGFRFLSVGVCTRGIEQPAPE